MMIEQLDELRVRLARAQRAESACVRKLNALLAAGPHSRAEYERLLRQCRAARETAQAAYLAWSRFVEEVSAAGSRGGAVENPADAAGAGEQRV
jgi:hypothetical protein